MKRLFLIGLALSALAGTAVAQTPPPTGADQPAAAPEDFSRPPRPHADNDEALTPSSDNDDTASAGETWSHERMRHDDRRKHPPMSRAAHFRLKTGDTDIDIKCAEDESMKTCADLVMRLIDRVEQSRY